MADEQTSGLEQVKAAETFVPQGARRVIIAGFGPVGRVVAEQLEAVRVHVTLIEKNPSTCFTQTRLGRVAVHGDVADPTVLEAAGVRDADALIITVPDEDAAVAACEAARQLKPGIFIAARTNFVSRGLLATRAGADHVVVEELVTAEAMRDAVIRQLDGNPPP